MKKDTMPSIYRCSVKAILEQHHDHICTFTDASKHENGSGPAAVSENSKKTHKTQTNSSMFTLEALAVLTGTDMTLKQQNKKFINFPVTN